MWDSNLHMGWFACVRLHACKYHLCVNVSVRVAVHKGRYILKLMNTFRLFAGCWIDFWESAWTALPWQGQDFLCVYVSAEGGVFYTSWHIRHSELWLIHDPAIKALWVRGPCIPVAFDRYVSSNCQIFVTAALHVPVESLSQICIITNTERSWSLMLLSWILHGAEFDWWYNRYATRWKLISSNVVLHLLWTCSFPHCSPVLTETKPATQHYMHVVRAWGQLTHSFPILHSASQHEQYPCCYETNFL